MNTYFINDEKTCLIDTSVETIPHTLIQGLKKIGKNLTDIDYVLISHIHLEHIASLAYIKNHAPNCIILTSPMNADYLANFEQYVKTAFQQNRDFQTVPGLTEFYQDLFSPIKSVQVNGILKENDQISLGTYELTVLETPGHCAEEITFLCKKKRLYFSSDFIIGDKLETWIAINPIFEHYGGDRRKYLSSLQKIAQLKNKIDIIFPAHGNIIHNPRKKIDMLLKLADEAPKQVLSILNTGPKTLEELVQICHNKNSTIDRKFYNASRRMRALLKYLLEEKKIYKKGEYYFIV